MPSGIAAATPWPKRGSGRGTRRPHRRAARADRRPSRSCRARPPPGPRRSSRSSSSEIGLAARHLVRRRLVVGRRAPRGRGDVGVAQRRARRPALTDVGWFAKPASWSARKSQSPLRSPVNIRPVRLPPCAAGARPTTTSTRAVRIAEAGQRPRPVRLARDSAGAVAPRPPRDGAPAAGRAGTRTMRRGCAGEASRCSPRRPGRQSRRHGKRRRRAR